jgi:hypothetical protein
MPGRSLGRAAATLAAAKTVMDLANSVGAGAAVSRMRQNLEHRRNASRYATQIGGAFGLVQFSDGSRRFVVWKDDVPKAAFPPFDGDLVAELADHEPANLRLSGPGSEG